MEGAVGWGAAGAVGAGPGRGAGAPPLQKEVQTSNGGEELQAAWRSRPAFRHHCPNEWAPEPAKAARVSSAKSIYAP